MSDPKNPTPPNESQPQEAKKPANFADRARQAHEAASDPVGFSKRKAGEAIGRRINPAIDKAKQKVTDAALEGAGKALAAPTGGISEAAVRAYKAGRAAFNKLNEATKKLGVDFLEAWKRHKWRIIGIGCLAGAAFAFFTIIVIVSAIGSLFTLDKNDKKDQELISSLESRVSSGKIQFLDSNDLTKIKEGGVSRNVINLLNFLSDRHDLLVPRYASGATADKIGTLDEPPEIEPTTVSIAAADYIKCANTEAKTKVGEARIYLSSNYDWAPEISRLKSGLTDDDMQKTYCAVDYYPEIDAKKSLSYGDDLGLNGGYYSIYELEKLANLAAQEKMTELVSEVLDANNALDIDPNSTETLLPELTTLDSTLGKYTLSTLKSKINSTYPESADSAIILSDENAFGVQIKYVK